MNHRREIHLGWLPFAALCLTACSVTNWPRDSKMVKTVDESDVAACTPLGNVAGNKDADSAASPSQAVKEAQQQAKEQAANLGATALVWVTPADDSSPVITGRAYSCPS